MKYSARIYLYIVILAATVGFVLYKRLGQPQTAPEFTHDNSELNRSAAAPASYADMLANAQQSVVSVYTADVVRVIRNQYGNSRDEMLRRYYNLPSRNQRVEERKVQQGVGSGVIISENGYILTNDHVIRDKQGKSADEVLVRLHDGAEYKATIIGRDPRSDLAVLKVDATDLPFATVADSEKARVGDVVFAIGNPMGVGMTVTSGIISATGRSIGIYGENGIESFIQTDASINPGNSGGALVDHQGRLIGINSAILSKTGSNIGIGFAIPSKLFVDISSELIEHGRMQRGALGVRIAPLNAELSKALKVDHGILIVETIEGYGAKDAGLQPGDVIVEIDGNTINKMKDLNIAITSKPRGEALDVTIIRDGKPMKTRVQLR